MLLHSMEENEYNVRKCTEWKSSDIMYDIVQYVIKGI
jgi:hypothetical protein